MTTAQTAHSPKHRAVDWVATTLDCIANDSADTLSVSALCTAAGISRPTFYSRFGNVDGLLAEVWLECGEQWLESLVKPDFVADAHSRALAHILAVARRKPELNEVVAPIVTRWWKTIAEGNKPTCVSWLVANRIGVLLIHSVDTGVLAISSLDPVIIELMSSNTLTTWDVADNLPSLPLSTPQTGDQLLDAAITVIASSGYHNASMSRIARHVQLTTGAIYPHFNSTDELLSSAFYRVQSLVVEQNAGVWEKLGFTVRNFGQFVVSGLLPERELWRHLRLETVLAAPSDQRIKDAMRVSLTDSAVALSGVVSATDLPETFKPVVHYLFHSLGVGFGVLHDVVDGIERLPHVAMAERLGSALNI